MLAMFRNATIGAAGCALAIGAAPAAWAGLVELRHRRRVRCRDDGSDSLCDPRAGGWC